MDSQEYEQLAQETQAHRVALTLADIRLRARQAVADARAARARSAEIIEIAQNLTALTQEWTVPPTDSTGDEIADGKPKDDDATHSPSGRARARSSEQSAARRSALLRKRAASKR